MNKKLSREDIIGILSIGWLILNPISMALICAAVGYFHLVSDMYPIIIGAALISIAYLFGIIVYNIFTEPINNHMESKNESR